MHISTEILVIAGLMVLALLFLMSMFARLYRKAGPHEALVVYGFRGTRVVKGHGTIIFPMFATCASRLPSWPVVWPRKYHSRNFTIDECSITTCETLPARAKRPMARTGTRMPYG